MNKQRTRTDKQRQTSEKKKKNNENGGREEVRRAGEGQQVRQVKVKVKGIGEINTNTTRRDEQRTIREERKKTKTRRR